MKKILLLLMAISSTASILAQEVNPSDDTSLIVWHKDGTQIILNLSEKPKISYVGETVVIESSERIELEFAAIKKMSYDPDHLTAIYEQRSSNEKPFRFEGTGITFIPSDKELHVKVIMLNGVVFKEYVVKKGEITTMAFDSFPANICLINVNGVTYKIKIK